MRAVSSSMVITGLWFSSEHLFDPLLLLTGSDGHNIKYVGASASC